jgi:2Fe-2S ferredoxin
MIKITYVESNGTEHVVEGKIGYSVMEIAKGNLIPGIDAECGGACACATCHVYVHEAWAAKAGNAGEMESSMLDCVFERNGCSRLSCQLTVDASLDGLIVHVPKTQR